MSNKLFNRETRVPNNYQLLRDGWNTYNYKIQSTTFISYNAINNAVQNLHTVGVVIKAIENPSGKFLFKNFFMKLTPKIFINNHNSVIQYKWPAIVEIYFTSSENLLDPYSLEVRNFRFTFFMTKTLKVRDVVVERKSFPSLIPLYSFVSPYNTPYNTPNDTSSTIRAVINAINYPSGQYSIREYFAKDYSYTLITAN
ncbi:hypothetical protein F8M41_006087 [Gigaspora margarita]|uniref:Uncharacterized protein n=1 Tax=Gigaspora margarita TaxID=4874 RepID=A0A8H3X8Z2_GIGMA|nr:hypothetical protein F8M41_006087 [Gigaspora margarita]